jgi:putative ATP-dependent endonuclease of OLD family
MAHPHILRLDLKRFRGFENLTWYPGPQMNLILGGGDAGKSTLLDAIALLLQPSNGYTLSDADYWQRQVGDEFVIEAVMYLPDSTAIHNLRTATWPWEWDGNAAVLPDVEGDHSPRQPVYRLRVRGTADLELVYEIEQPDNSNVALPTALRKAIGLVRLVGDDRSERDLRLVQGGALDRLLTDKGLRAKLGYNIGQTSVQDALSSEACVKLNALDQSFDKSGLPSGLQLGFVGAPGLSVNALIGLTAKRNDVALPLLSWGSGTRRLSALHIASVLQEGQPIVVIDEAERGLEPYRQRSLISELSSKEAQSFVTTHSATVIGAASRASMWYVNANRAVGSLPTQKIVAQQAKDPDLFLARFAIVAEGITEVGFLRHLLSVYVSVDWPSLGIVVTDAGSNDSVLILLEALLSGGVRFGGFADTESACKHPGRWTTVKQKLGSLLYRWDSGCLEENLIPLVDSDEIQNLVADPEGKKTGYRLRTLADRLCISTATYEAVLTAAGSVAALRQLIIQAACGTVPDGIIDPGQKKAYKSHASCWFKSLEGGDELAAKFLALNHTIERATVKSSLIAFLSAIQTELGLANDQS